MSPADEETLATLDALEASAGELHRQIRELRERTALALKPQRTSYARMLPLDARLTLIEHISSALRVIARDGNRFRRMEARSLYAEGLTMAQLAAVFGVSRQRISAILQATEGQSTGPDSQSELLETA
ncbi:MAG TPA: hypothetical protein VG253_15425 [Streptosporangiaceae bacterium]|jgi:AraC-like DNA-binding protein|nr:hypothetical protein [Streptosporangiaceae bacterium]